MLKLAVPGAGSSRGGEQHEVRSADAEADLVLFGHGMRRASWIVPHCAGANGRCTAPDRDTIFSFIVRIYIVGARVQGHFSVAVLLSVLIYLKGAMHACMYVCGGCGGTLYSQRQYFFNWSGI